MMDSLSKEELDVGKILVLYRGHKLKVSEIKKITRAQKVKKIKWTNYEDIDSLIWINIYEGIVHINTDYSEYLDMYYVEGDEAVTTALRLKTDNVLASLDWNYQLIKDLHNARLTIDSIQKAKHYLSIAKESHDELCEILKQQKLSNSLMKKTKSLEAINKDYGDAELKLEMEKIENAMKNRW